MWYKVIVKIKYRKKYYMTLDQLSCKVWLFFILSSTLHVTCHIHMGCSSSLLFCINLKSITYHYPSHIYMSKYSGKSKVACTIFIYDGSSHNRHWSIGTFYTNYYYLVVFKLLLLLLIYQKHSNVQDDFEL